MQPRQFCLGAKLTISRSSFQKEFLVLNTIRSVYFNDAIYNPNKFERSKLAVMNPKAQAMFAHILVDATFIYLLLANKNTQVDANGIQ